MNLKRIATGLIAGAVICGSTGVYPYAAMNYAVAAETADKAETEEKEEALTAESFLAGGYDAKNATIYSDGSKTFNMNGRTYNQGVVFAGQYFYQSTTASISYNTENISSLSWVWGHIDNTSMSDATVSIYLDDVLTDKYSLSADKMQQEYSVDVSETSILKISVTFNKDAKFAIADVTVDDIKPATSPKIPEYKSLQDFIDKKYNTTSYTNSFSYVSDLEAKKVNGRYYYNGISFSGDKYAETTNASVSFNTENINNFSCSFGHVDNTTMKNATVYVYQDSVLMEKFDLSPRMPIMEYNLDVSDISELRFVVQNKLDSAYAMVDIKVDEFTASKKGKAPTFKIAEDFINSGYNRSYASVFNVSSALEAKKSNGRSYYQGIIFGNDTYDTNGTIEFNVENINTITGILGHLDGSKLADATLCVYKDNVLTDEIKMFWHYPSKEITIDVSDCKNLRLYMYTDYGVMYAFTDISIDEIKPKKTFTSPDYKSSKEFASSRYNTQNVSYFDFASELEAYTVNGKKCLTGFRFSGSYILFNEKSFVGFNTENVNTVSWELGSIDNSSADEVTFSIYCDGILYDEVQVKSNSEPIKQVIDVSNTGNLLVRVSNLSNGEFILSNIEISDEIVEVKIPLGDVDNDSTVSSSDASLVLAEYAALSTSGESILDAKQKKAADVNGDETIDASDASLILAYYAYVSTGGTETDMEKWLALDK